MQAKLFKTERGAIRFAQKIKARFPQHMYDVQHTVTPDFQTRYIAVVGIEKGDSFVWVPVGPFSHKH